MTSEGSLRIPEMEKLYAGLHGLKDLELKHFEANFTERVMTRGDTLFHGTRVDKQRKVGSRDRGGMCAGGGTLLG